MESPENDNAVFRPSHKPWKSIKPIPTFPLSRQPRDIYEKIPKRRRPKLPAPTPSGSFLDWKRLSGRQDRTRVLRFKVEGQSMNLRIDVAIGNRAHSKHVRASIRNLRNGRRLGACFT